MDTQEPSQALWLSPYDVELPKLDAAQALLFMSIKAMIPSPYAEYAMECILAIGLPSAGDYLYTVMLFRNPISTYIWSGARAWGSEDERYVIDRRIVVERVSGNMQKDDADHVTLWSQRDGLREVNLPEDWWS